MVLGTRNDLDRIVEIWNLGKVELIDQLYAPTYVYAVNRRFRNVSLSPVSSWLLLREWSVAPPSPTPSR